jgi:hypothetical protein
LSELTTNRGKLTTNAKVDNYAEQLVEAIKKAIQETTPRKRRSPHSKRWWTVELTTRWRREANKLRNASEQRVSLTEQRGELKRNNTLEKYRKLRKINGRNT